MATELEIMIHAKGYMDKLANGVNPLTDEPLADTDIVNNIRISRCLFYVSDVLRQVIERGGLKKTSKTGNTPFQLTEDQVKQFQWFEKPIFVTGLTERINSLIQDENMRKLSHRSITAFLEQEGYLRQYTDSFGKTRREPTESGRELGISTEVRTGQRGDYTVVLYDQRAQMFILDHISQIAEINQMPRKDRMNISHDSAERVDPETGEIIQD